MTFIQSYKQIKQNLANLLTERGINSSSNEGLTTLINKIPNIPAIAGNYNFSINIRWDNEIDENEIPDQILIGLTDGNRISDSFYITAENNWSYLYRNTFLDLDIVILDKLDDYDYDIVSPREPLKDGVTYPYAILISPATNLPQLDVRLHLDLPETEYFFTLESDKNTLQLGETAILTASLEKGLNEEITRVPVEGETIWFYDSSNVGYNAPPISYASQKYETIILKCEGDGKIIFKPSAGSIFRYSNGETVVSNSVFSSSLYNYELIIENNVLKGGVSNSTTRTTIANLTNGYAKISFSTDVQIISNTWDHFYSKGITDSNGQCSVNYVGKGNNVNVNIIAQYTDLTDNINLRPMLLLQSDKNTIYTGEQTQLTASLLSGEENESVYINKIIDDEDLNMELTSIRNQYNHIIKAKVTDENNNGLENIRIKLYKED